MRDKVAIMRSRKKVLIIVLTIVILALFIALVIIANHKGENNKAKVENSSEMSDDKNEEAESSVKQNEIDTKQAEINENKEDNVEIDQSSEEKDEENQGIESEIAQNSASDKDLPTNTSETENTVDDKENSETDPVYSLQAKTVLDASTIGDTSDYFKIYEISEGDSVYNRINGKSYRKNNNISLSDLRYLKLLYYNFDNQIRVGEIIVNKSIADSTLSVFKDLYAEKYQINSVELVDNYWTGDGASTDIASQAADNTSAFNYRMTTSGKKLSNHALGKAIDINPLENPYIITENGVAHCDIDASAPYFDRASGLPHIILKGDSCESVFEKYGFKWGGDWTNPVDYQHFEKK